VHEHQFVTALQEVLGEHEDATEEAINKIALQVFGGNVLMLASPTLILVL
jgi:hypothetical protein